MLFGHTVSLGLPRGEVSEHTSPTFVLSLAGYRVSEYQVFPLTSAPWLALALASLCIYSPPLSQPRGILKQLYTLFSH